MEKGAACKCLCPSMFHISCTKLYVKYGEGMLGYCPIPLYPNSIYMIVLNVLEGNSALNYKAAPPPRQFLPLLIVSPPCSPLFPPFQSPPARRPPLSPLPTRLSALI